MIEVIVIVVMIVIILIIIVVIIVIVVIVVIVIIVVHECPVAAWMCNAYTIQGQSKCVLCVRTRLNSEIVRTKSVAQRCAYLNFANLPEFGLVKIKSARWSFALRIISVVCPAFAVHNH